MDRQPHRVFTVNDLLHIDDDPNRWIVPLTIPRGNKTIVYGQPSSYKSTLIFDLCVGVASGGLLLRQLPIMTYGPVLLVSTEGSLYDNKDRILMHCRAHKVSPSEIDLHFCQDPFLLDDPEDVDELRQCIKDLKPILVVLDPLDSFFGGDENSARETKPVRRAIDALQRELGVAFVIIHHERKDSKESKGSSGSTLRGSSAWYGWSDSVLKIETSHVNLGMSDDPKEVVTVKSEKQRNGKRGHVFSAVPIMDEDMGEIRFGIYDGKSSYHVIAEFHKLLVYKTLKFSAEPLTNSMVAEKLGVHYKRTQEALMSLEADGYIAKDVDITRPVRGGKERTIHAWRIIPRKTFVDMAIGMMKMDEAELKEIEEKYTLNVEPIGKSRVNSGNNHPVRTDGVGRQS